MKKLFILLFLFLAILLYLSGCIFGETFTITDNNIENYLSSKSSLGRHFKYYDIIDDYAADVLPNLDDLPKYEDIYYQYYIDSSYWVTESMLLVVTYSQNTYLDEKEELNNTFTFLGHVVKDDDNEDFLIPEYIFQINEYEFRVIDEDQSTYMEYPKFFGMIATSDKNNTIAYLYFYDQDLDIIGRENEENPMQDFVERYFQYEW